jgi:peroxiredoxin Q/BCP
MGFVVVGVSPDSVKSHVGFINKHELPFMLISDADHSIADSYGAWGLKKFMGREYYGILRKTFIINAEGIIEKVFDKVDTKRHFEQISDSYK